MEMTAVDFIRTKERMCNKLTCDHCPISSMNNKTDKCCPDFIKYFPNSAVLLVQKWGEDNQFMTNKDKFKEVFGVDYAMGNFMTSEWWNKEYKGGD